VHIFLFNAFLNVERFFDEVLIMLGYKKVNFFSSFAP